jgi:hypothetical protein
MLLRGLAIGPVVGFSLDGGVGVSDRAPAASEAIEAVADVVRRCGAALRAVSSAQAGGRSADERWGVLRVRGALYIDRIDSIWLNRIGFIYVDT